MRRVAAILAPLACLLALTGCHTDMWIQPKLKPQRESDFFPNGAASREQPAHTVSQDPMREDELLYRGSQAGKQATVMPFPVTRDVLVRGREQFDAMCSHCHGRLGYGDGMIAQRGLALRRTPANYHTDRLRNMPIGHFYDVITNGFGVMFSHASKVTPRDRWCIAAYIRALQLSQHATIQDVPSDVRGRLEAGETVLMKAGQGGER